MSDHGHVPRCRSSTMARAVRAPCTGHVAPQAGNRFLQRVMGDRRVHRRRRCRHGDSAASARLGQARPPRPAAPAAELHQFDRQLGPRRLQHGVVSDRRAVPAVAMHLAQQLHHVAARLQAALKQSPAAAAPRRAVRRLAHEAAARAVDGGWPLSCGALRMSAAVCPGIGSVSSSTSKTNCRAWAERSASAHSLPLLAHQQHGGRTDHHQQPPRRRQPRCGRWRRAHSARHGARHVPGAVRHRPVVQHTLQLIGQAVDRAVAVGRPRPQRALQHGLQVGAQRGVHPAAARRQRPAARRR